MTERLIVAAHQPNFLPYLGIIDKLSRADVFLIRDDTQFTERDFHHRNKIKISGSKDGNPNSKWLTIPVHKCLDDIKNIRIKAETKVKGKLYWHEEMLKDIRSSYGQAQYFGEFYPALEGLFKEPCESLRDYNMRFIKFIKEVFRLPAEIILSSELIDKRGIQIEKESEHKESINLALLCEGASRQRSSGNAVYLSGDGRGGHLVTEPFERRGISIELQNFQHPTYNQLHHPDFLPYMSFIDFILNAGTILPKKG